MPDEISSQVRLGAEAIAAGIEAPSIPNREFIAKASPHEDILPALQTAMAECEAAGGGRVVVPAGIYRCNGPIHLKSRMELHLAEGALLKFTPDTSKYLPQVPTRFSGVEMWNYSPMVYGNELHDVAVTGKGVLCGGNEQWLFFRDKQYPSQMRSREMAKEGIPMDQRVFGNGDFIRPSMVQFRECRRVLLEGFSCLNSPCWTIHPIYCRHVLIRDVHLDSMFITNDGIDVDSSEDVLIEKCTFRNGDDSVVLKSGRDHDGLRVNRPTRRVAVRDCISYDVMTGFAVGSEISGGVEDVYVHDFRMDNLWHHAIYLKSAQGRGGITQRIHVSDIQIDKAGFNVVNILSSYEGQHNGEHFTQFKNVQINNVHCKQTHTAFSLQGSVEHPLEDIRLDNVTVDHADNIYDNDEFAQDVHFRNVTVNHIPVTRP